MAPSSKRESTPLSQQLAEEPFRFDFFQAVRIFQHLAWEETNDDVGLPHQPIGYDYAPDREVVRFRALPSHQFPSGDISSLTWNTTDQENEGQEHEGRGGTQETATEGPVAEVVVPFMGLTGPAGVLPQHYTQTVIDRVRSKDHSLRDFWDLFNHRVLSHFYRAWQKYRFHIQFEEAACRSDRPSSEDAFTTCLYSLVGLRGGSVRNRLRLDDVAWLYYGGHFAHRLPNVASLTAILEDYFELDVQVHQFQGQWLYLSMRDQSTTPRDDDLDGQNNLLGINVVVGEKVWSVENKFRIRVGPLGYDKFRRFMPTGDMLIPLCQTVRAYCGPEYDFDVQPVLEAEDTPWCKLGDEGNPSCLGWNTWLRADHQANDVDDAVFQHSGAPLA